ncbi:hypothetical protein Bbelb_287950 [Branchiostoma belcheri]|nr:hypothetical protein Bbelb_287950 [Branchiostoma belcheri]
MSCSFGSQESECGPTHRRPTYQSVVPLTACDKDLTSYLIGLGVSGRGKGVAALTEQDLILNRSGRFGLSVEQKSALTVCPKHRYDLTTNWIGGKRSSCTHPEHKGKRVGLKNPRRVSLALSVELVELYETYNRIVPVGSAVCNTCRKRDSKDTQSAETGVPSSAQDMAADEPGPSQGPKSIMGPPAQPVPASTSTPTVQLGPRLHPQSTMGPPTQREPMSHASTSLATGQVSSQEPAMQRDSESSSTISELEGPTRVDVTFESQSSSTTSEGEADTSIWVDEQHLQEQNRGQESDLWQSLVQAPPFYEEEPPAKKKKMWDHQTVQTLVKAYQQAGTWQTRQQILSLFADDYSKQDLQELIPGLSKWRIDQARAHAAEAGPGKPVQQQQIYRTRLNPVKTDHFLAFLTQPHLLQDVAYGTKTMKLDSGEVITIPAAIRTIIPSRIIQQYQQYCSSSRFEPLRERTLFKIMEVCAARQQKSLQGLDYISTEGAEAFDALGSVVDTLVQSGAPAGWADSAKQNLKAGKRYLKTDFKTHIKIGDRCGDHCITYALSEKGNHSFAANCNHNHDLACDRCVDIDHGLSEIRKMVEQEGLLSEEQRSRLLFSFEQSSTAILSWKAHLLRAVNQDFAKQSALQQLDDHTALIIMDWAMKFLPLKYREQMSEFFGKRGRSWHVTAVITKGKEEKYDVECFVHVFNNWATSGQKADATQVARDMQTTRGPDGQLLFLPGEWRSAKQITSFFARLSAAQRRQESPESITDEDVECLEEAEEWQAVRDTVYQNIDYSHPLMFEHINICELAKTKGLNTLKIKELRHIAEHFHLPISGPKSRKTSYVHPLETIVRTCVCMD